MAGEVIFIQYVKRMILAASAAFGSNHAGWNPCDESHHPVDVYVE